MKAYVSKHTSYVVIVEVDDVYYSIMRGRMFRLCEINQAGWRRAVGADDASLSDSWKPL